MRADGVLDADDDDLGDRAVLGGGVERLVDLPLVAAEGERRIEEVLAVVHVEDGEARARVLVVRGRQVGPDGAVVAERRRVPVGDELDDAAGDGGEVRVDVDGGAGRDLVVRPARPGGVVEERLALEGRGQVGDGEGVRVVGAGGERHARGPGQPGAVAAQRERVAAGGIVDADRGRRRARHVAAASRRRAIAGPPPLPPPPTRRCRRRRRRCPCRCCWGSTARSRRGRRSVVKRRKAAARA